MVPTRLLRSRPCAPALPALLAVSALCAPPAAANGVSAETTLLVVDPRDPDSLRIANHYVAARRIPAAGVLYAQPVAPSIGVFQQQHRRGFLGTLAQRGTAEQTSLVVLSAGPAFQTSAAGILADPCFPVSRVSSIAPYMLAYSYPAGIPAGASSQTGNAYHTAGYAPAAFDARVRWSGGVETSSGGTRYLLGAQLGQTGPLGNTPDEIVAMIARSVAADASQPGGTFYFCQTNDAARSAPRHGFYTANAAQIAALGGGAQHIYADLPPPQAYCLGVMTGLADPQIDAGTFVLGPGAFADHLTSYAGTLDLASQTKMTRWIAKGAVGSSGTVEEPCNYPGKFPRANLHTFYYGGLSLGEAWFRSLGFAPFQVLFLGDPLCRPYAQPPQASIALPPGPLAGTVAVHVSATGSYPLDWCELYVDGVLASERHLAGAAGAGFAIDTTALDDGWHELRAVARGASGPKVPGRAIAAVQVANHGRTALLSANTTSGDLRTRFELAVAAAGGAVARVELFHNSRVVAAGDGSLPLAVHGRMLGAGPVEVRACATFADGRRAWSAPLALAVAGTDSGGPAVPPVASPLHVRLRSDASVWIELPYTSDAPLGSGTPVLVSQPAQASAQLFDNLPAALLHPQAGASGGDSFRFRIDGPGGSSAEQVVSIEWIAAPSCPAPSTYCAATPNSTGLPASIGWNGSTSIADNDYSLACYDLPPATLGMFFLGQGQTQTAFGNGFRCVSGTLYRLSPQPTNVFGDVERRIDFTQAPWNAGPGALRAGSTWNAQFWYRNPAAGGAGFNLSDALSTTFCP